MAFAIPAISRPIDPDTITRGQVIADVGGKIGDVARHVCQAPELFGYSRSASGTLNGRLDVSRLIRSFGNAGVSAQIRGTTEGWRGVLQRDAAGAHNVSTQCAEHVFSLMWQTFALSRSADVKPHPSTRPKLPPRKPPAVDPPVTKPKVLSVLDPSPVEWKPAPAGMQVMVTAVSVEPPLPPGSNDTNIVVTFQGASREGLSLLLSNDGKRAGSVSSAMLELKNGSQFVQTPLTLVQNRTEPFILGDSRPVFVAPNENKSVVGFIVPLPDLFYPSSDGPCTVIYTVIDYTGKLRGGRSEFTCPLVIPALNFTLSISKSPTEN